MCESFGEVMEFYIRIAASQSRAAVPHLSPAAGTHSFVSITRLKAASQEAEAVRREQTVWERKVGELQARCTTLEEEKYEALAKVRESVQVAEEAALQKDQVIAVTLSSSLLFFPVFLSFLLAEPSPQSAPRSDKCSLQHFRTWPTEMCCCVCFYPFPSGAVKRETEGRGAGEDKGSHQTLNPGCCSPHQKRGAELLTGYWFSVQELLGCFR